MRLLASFGTIAFFLSGLLHSHTTPGHGDGCTIPTSKNTSIRNAYRSGWSFKLFGNLVVFGDSYSDENQLKYFYLNNGSAPPVGTLLPETLDGADGGRVCPRYVVQYSNQNIKLYDYAVRGAVCSNQISPGYFAPIRGPYPDLNGYGVTQFLADKQNDLNVATGGPFFTPSINHDNTVYAFFDGTNELGSGAFFSDSQVQGNTLIDYIDCIFKQMDRVYGSGARYLVPFNLIPLQLTPQVAQGKRIGRSVKAWDIPGFERPRCIKLIKILQQSHH